MPHVTIEYSANLDAGTDMQAVCEAVHDALLATGLFETGAVRVRALRCAAHAIADLDPRNGFAHAILRMGHGRPEPARRAAGEAVFEALETAFAGPLAQPHFGLSLEILEIDPRLSWKRNSMHARLRAGAMGETG